MLTIWLAVGVLGRPAAGAAVGEPEPVLGGSRRRRRVRLQDVPWPVDVAVHHLPNARPVSAGATVSAAPALRQVHALAATGVAAGAECGAPAIRRSWTRQDNAFWLMVA